MTNAPANAQSAMIGTALHEKSLALAESMRPARMIKRPLAARSKATRGHIRRRKA